MIFEALVNQVLEEQPLPSRITIGSDEVRNIVKTGKVTSKGPYSGHTFFGTKEKPEQFPSTMQNFWRYYGQEGPFKQGKKAGYILKGDPKGMQTPGIIDPAKGRYHDSAYYKDQGFVTLPPGSSAQNIKTIQRIKQPKSSWTELRTNPAMLGKERDFNRFMQIYNKLSDAFKKGKIQVPPPKITPGAGMAGAAALMQFLNTEVPPDMKNSLLGGGGLGIKGKFEATP